jgi:hypothetical protein
MKSSVIKITLLFFLILSITIPIHALLYVLFGQIHFSILLGLSGAVGFFYVSKIGK